MNTKMINFETKGGHCDACVAYPEGQKNLPLVLFYMDAIGLRPRIFEMVGKLASHGYFVLAPNLFYRTKPAPIIDYATLLKPENREEMFKHIMPIASQLTADLAKQDVVDYLQFGKTQAQVDPHKAGLVGYCMGGNHALSAAGNYPEEFKVVASFHAGRLATDLETSPHRLFKNIKAEIYIAHADKDQSMPPEQIEKVAATLNETPGKHKAEVYKDCLHGWTMSDMAAYNKQGDEKHWSQLLDLFERNLKS